MGLVDRIKEKLSEDLEEFKETQWFSFEWPTVRLAFYSGISTLTGVFAYANHVDQQTIVESYSLRQLYEKRDAVDSNHDGSIDLSEMQRASREMSASCPPLPDIGGLEVSHILVKKDDIDFKHPIFDYFEGDVFVELSLLEPYCYYPQYLDDFVYYELRHRTDGRKGCTYSDAHQRNDCARLVPEGKSLFLEF